MHEATRSLRWALSVSISALWLAACSPSPNWRELRPDGAGLIVMFPCRPSIYVRPLTLAGSTVTLTLHACSAEAATWAVAYAPVADPSLVAPVLRAMAASASTNIGAPPAGVGETWAPRGATPNPAAGRWLLRGRLPDGSHAESRVAVFARGLVAVQATIVGTQVADEAAEMFFAGLRVQP